MKSERRGEVNQVENNIVLRSDNAEAQRILKIVAKSNCVYTLKLCVHEVARFLKILREQNFDDAIIAVVNADDIHGRQIAKCLVEESKIQAIRDNSKRPFVCCIADRIKILQLVADFDVDAAIKLKAKKGVSILVIDNGFAEVYHM